MLLVGKSMCVCQHVIYKWIFSLHRKQAIEYAVHFVGGLLLNTFFCITHFQIFQYFYRYGAIFGHHGPTKKFKDNLINNEITGRG